MRSAAADKADTQSTQSVRTGGSADPRKAEFRSIQALRAVAALLVVLLHSFQMWGERVDPLAPGVSWMNGAAGVDIFFVVSGFVMIVSSQRLIDHPRGWLEFLRLRFVRIVPLYWVMTTLKLLAVVLLADLALRTRLDLDYIADSYLFLPTLDQTGKFRPLLPVGWTLTFELLFYLLFAAAMAMRMGLVRVLVPALAALAVIALFRTPSWPVWTVLADTIVLEFAFGLLLARAVLARRSLPPFLAAVLLVGGFVAIFGLPEPSHHARVLVWGLPAAAIVTGAVFLEPVLHRNLPRWLLLLGDASYSIYLCHGFVLPVCGILIGAYLAGPAGELTGIAGSLVLSVLVGTLMHLYLERPMTAALRGRFSAIRQSSTPATAASAHKASPTPLWATSRRG